MRSIPTLLVLSGATCAMPASWTSDEVEAPGGATRRSTSTDPIPEVRRDGDGAATPDERRVTLSLVQARLGDVASFFEDVGYPFTVPQELASFRFSLLTDVPVTPTQARWAFSESLACAGLTVDPATRVVTAGGDGAHTDRVTRVARARSGDAEDAWRLTERTWRGRLRVTWEGELIAVCGGEEEVEQAMGRLYEADRVGREVLEGG